MSTLAQRTNALQPTAAEIGDVDAILRRARDIEARRRASYAPVKPVQKPVDNVRVIDIKPRPDEHGRLPHPLDQRAYTFAIQGPCQPEHPLFGYYIGDRDFLYVATPKLEEILKRRIKIVDCIKYVCKADGVTVSDMESPRRTAAIVLPRQKAMYIARHNTIRSLPEIARKFGGRDHTTALHAVRRVQKLVDAGEWFPPSAEEILRTVRPEALIEEAGE